jgi:hypothetical protein
MEVKIMNEKRIKDQRAKAKNWTKYKINGRIDPKILEKVPSDLGLRIYAVRDRKVLGSSLIKKDGGFKITYNYEIYAKGRKELALGTSLIVGPDLPGDGILKQKFPKPFLPPNEFKKIEDKWCATVKPEVIQKAISKSLIVKYLLPWWETYCYEWRPCIQILACSSITGGLCYGEQPLTNVHVRIHEVRWPLLYPIFGPNPQKYTKIVAEGNTDQFGYFKANVSICKSILMIPLYQTLGYLVEVGQIIDGMFISIYKDPDDQLRELKTDLCEEIYINKSDVVIPEDAEGYLTGNEFKFTRIGDIPVGYINQDSTSSSHGYANSMAATDSATLKVVDSAFYGTIKLYANIGSGIVNTVKYYRIKRSYETDDTTIVDYVQVQFPNLRESTPTEISASGPYKTEFMGPIDNNIYIYPNPYDLTADKQWVYKGLVMVLNTRTLPLLHGKYTFTLEPLDSSKNLITNIDNPEKLSCTILVDNTSPTGSIGDIMGPGGQLVSACGFLKLPFARTESRNCDGTIYTRNVVTGEVSVPFAGQDGAGHINNIILQAHFGDSNCDDPVTLVGAGKKPRIGYGGSFEYQNYDSDVPSIQRPIWSGRNDYCASSTQDWDECAYQFRLRIHKRVTNGQVKYPWWDFTKHITITRT